MELGWIAGLIASVVSALLGVWVGHQLREGSAKRDWKRHRVSEQAREVRQWVKMCAAFADAVCLLGEDGSVDEEGLRKWKDGLQVVLEKFTEVAVRPRVLFILVDDDRLLDLLEEMRTIGARLAKWVVEEVDEARARPEWAEDEMKGIKTLAMKIDARLDELVEEA